MELSNRPVELHLKRQALHRVADAAQVRIVCHEGAVWITLDNDSRDFVLEANGSFSTHEHRPALIYALHDSHISVAPAAVNDAQPSIRQYGSRDLCVAR